MIPIVIAGVAIASAIYGAKKGYDANENFNRAEDINRKAKRIFDEAKEAIETQREKTHQALQVLGEQEIKIWQETLAPWAERIQCIKGMPEHLSLQEGRRIDIEAMAHEMQDISFALQDALQTVGAAGAAGLATSFAAVSGVSLLASASTGTAISALSGAAATNATLAWLGGGAIAAGGGGIALGTMVLGGIAAGPAIAVAGWMASAKAEEAVANARSNLDEAKLAVKEAEKAVSEMQTIRRFSDMLNETLIVLNAMAQPHMNWLKDLTDKGDVEYSRLSHAEQKRIFLTISSACTLNGLINTPIINDEGIVSDCTQRRIHSAKNMLESSYVFNDSQLFSKLGEILKCGQAV